MLARTTFALALAEPDARGCAFRNLQSTPPASTLLGQPCPALATVASSTAVVPAQLDQVCSLRTPFVVTVEAAEHWSMARHFAMTSGIDRKPGLPPLNGMSVSRRPWISSTEIGRVGLHAG